MIKPFVLTVAGVVIWAMAISFHALAQDDDADSSASEQERSSEGKKSEQRDRFIPSEEVSADQEVAFPADI